MPLKIGVNGFGRVGRALLRAWLMRREQSPVQIVAVNDLGDPANLAYLLCYDTVYPFKPHNFHYDADKHTLVFDGHPVALSSALSPQDCPWQPHDVEWVVECTGSQRTWAAAQGHFAAGAARVLVSAPTEDPPDAALVFGANHRDYDPAEHRFIGAASCTTHALAAVCKPILHHYGIDGVMMSEIHAVTLDQAVLDTVHPNWVRGRAACFNMVPTETTGDKIIGSILPALAGKVSGYSMRVPVACGACLDLTIKLHRTTTLPELLEFLDHASIYSQGVLALETAPLVSSDYLGCPASAVIDCNHLRIQGDMLHVLAWYDNEWGYVNRLLDFLEFVAGRDAN